MGLHCCTTYVAGVTCAIQVWNRTYSTGVHVRYSQINTLTAGAAYIRVFIFYQHIKYHLLTMVNIKFDINQQYLKTVDLHFVKSE